MTPHARAATTRALGVVLMQSSLISRHCVIDGPPCTSRSRTGISSRLSAVGTSCSKIGSFSTASLFPCNRFRCVDQNSLFRKSRGRPPRLPKACDAEHLHGPLALPQRLMQHVDLTLSRHDVDIFRLAIPALCSTLLDPLMGLVDTGVPSLDSVRWLCHEHNGLSGCENLLF